MQPVREADHGEEDLVENVARLERGGVGGDGEPAQQVERYLLHVACRMSHVACSM